MFIVECESCQYQTDYDTLALAREGAGRHAFEERSCDEPMPYITETSEDLEPPTQAAVLQTAFNLFRIKIKLSL